MLVWWCGGDGVGGGVRNIKTPPSLAARSLPAVTGPPDLQLSEVRSNSLADRHLSLAVRRRLVKKQRALVRENQGLLAAVVRSLRTAHLECQHHFRHERWNCPPPPPATARRRHFFGKIATLRE
ncbi:hypothetical protein HAZT_HAZT000247 [Hyalella azteca]|uniref:Protein Wnt n=1 Tax=Hyalella azteca TaxID=294128 RepID=A0A6A0HHZ5_HYAAZ|nr:hypothetical protein HAZT_HAZT000247 [Hyalella azteca]